MLTGEPRDLKVSETFVTAMEVFHKSYSFLVYPQRGATHALGTDGARCYQPLRLRQKATLHRMCRSVQVSFATHV